MAQKDILQGVDRLIDHYETLVTPPTRTIKIGVNGHRLGLRLGKRCLPGGEWAKTYQYRGFTLECTK